MLWLNKNGVHLLFKSSQSQKSFNRSSDKNSADTAETGFININN